MSIEMISPSPETVLRRIDMIIAELQGLRQAVQVMSTQQQSGLTQQLYGALGQGSWDEYDLDLDSSWQRFEQCVDQL